MTTHEEHMMELASEIVALRRENTKLKQQMSDQMAPVQMVRDLKSDLFKAYAQLDLANKQIQSLLKEHREAFNIAKDSEQRINDALSALLR